jgi:NhaP-type Na+/H+ or K+/H+ antiporter
MRPFFQDNVLLTKKLHFRSACNDSTAAIFIWISLLIDKYGSDAGTIAKEFFIWTILYEMIVGALFGIICGLLARKALHHSKLHDLIDQENFLSFAIALAVRFAMLFTS